jgi:hypothetical protein
LFKEFAAEEEAKEQSGSSTTNMHSFISVSDGFNKKERIEYEYLKKRDPMKEFFSLVSTLHCNLTVCLLDPKIDQNQSLAFQLDFND